MRNSSIVLIAIIVIIMVLVLGTVAIGTRSYYSCAERAAEAKRERELEQKNSNNYAKALELLRSGDYLEARKLLDYLWDYRDGNVLLTYARARIAFLHTDYWAYSTYDYLAEIPTDYNGDMADEIAAFRTEAELRRPELKVLYDTEQERRAESERKLAEQKAQWREKMKAEAATHKRPYVGMDREFISYTQLGIYDAYENRNGVWFYYWYLDGKVFHVSIKDGKVAMTGSQRVSGVTKKGSSITESDPYNVSDYTHVDDFYYDHVDDFFNYQDAEDYFDAHN